MSEMNHLLPMLSDQPAEDDRLNFDPYAKTLAEIVADPTTRTPLTIGVFGDWGYGKTSLMQMVRKRLRATAGTDFPVQAVWFNAWLYSREQALWRALIARVLAGARQFLTLAAAQLTQLERLESRLYQAAEPENGALTLPPDVIPELPVASLPARAGLELWRRQAVRQGTDVTRVETLIADVEASYALTHRARLVALDDFQREFEALSAACVAPHGRLVVFVDDLDRCLPDQAVEVLEAIKLFLDAPGFIFVLGLDRAVIEEGIRVRYKEYATQIEGARYLEKIIQLPFNLPPIDARALTDYIHSETAGTLPDPRCETVFGVGLEPNPRRIKRTLNVFLLLWRLAQNREELHDAIQPVRLAKIVIIQQYHPRLFALIAQGPHYLVDLERRFRETRGGEGAGEQRSRGAGELGGERAEEKGEEISAGALAEFLNHSLLRALLTCTAEAEADANFVDLTPARVREYIYLTRSAVEEAAPTQEAAALPFEPQLVTIPAGPFLMGTPESEVAALTKLAGLKDKEVIMREVPQHEVTLPAYAIARYPVTNAEFRRFIEDGGYTVRDYWTEAGWQQKEKENWTQPRLWDDEKWNDPAQPVVGVSWYEAVAYCAWLTARVKKYTYRLPTEAEWEKAARGTDGRRYPWGNEWDAARCNNKESGPGKTTPVGQYPAGDSPYGVGDMVGQVWEWCSSKYGGTGDKPKFGYPYRSEGEREDLEGDDTRILRGGSWYDDNPAGVCRGGYRDWYYPWGRFNLYGFRCVRTSPQKP